MKSFFNEMVNFSLESSGPTKFWILPKLYEFCKYCCKNAATISFNIERLNSGEKSTIIDVVHKIRLCYSYFYKSAQHGSLGRASK